MPGRGKTWILTGSPENFAATRERGFKVIGMKEGRRNMAEQMEPGDLIVFYLTRVKRFGGADIAALFWDAVEAKVAR